MKQEAVYVGIDVSKSCVDVAVEVMSEVVEIAKA